MWAGCLRAIMTVMNSSLNRRNDTITAREAAPLTIRQATFADLAAVATLAELDSSTPPQGDVLLAEVDDELWAALSLQDGHAVADPLRPSAEAVGVLAERRRQLRRPRRARSHRFGGLRLARA
jgi:hypothetical protein